MRYQRTLIGVSSLLTAAVGLILLWTNDGRDTSISGILIRVGVMLGVIWLGYPALMKSGGKQSLAWFLALFAGIFLVAFRPRLFIAVVLLTCAALAINLAWKRFNQGISDQG